MYGDEYVKDILRAISEGGMDVEQGLDALRDLPFRDIGHTKIDLHRTLRNGLPEVVYGAGKTPEQIADIFEHMRDRGNILATRVSQEAADFVRARFPEVEYNALGRTLSRVKEEISFRKGEVGVVTAGTSDLPVAEEARVTCGMFGSRARIHSDVGVAGIHRLFHRMEDIRKASVLIVVAGMEGALSSVVAGLVSRPVIAVPTSVGYGANFAGLSALLGMLTSCAAGVTVVNIDNGYGAACAACKINNLLG